VNRDILRLEENPRPHGVEKMETKEKLYRVIYQIRDEILLVLVVKVGDRKEVYRRLK
jgi:mRNA interferase RelE/StbE